MAKFKSKPDIKPLKIEDIKIGHVLWLPLYEPIGTRLVPVSRPAAVESIRYGRIKIRPITSLQDENRSARQTYSNGGDKDDVVTIKLWKQAGLTDESGIRLGVARSVSISDLPPLVGHLGMLQDPDLDKIKNADHHLANLIKDWRDESPRVFNKYTRRQNAANRVADELFMDPPEYTGDNKESSVSLSQLRQDYKKHYAPKGNIDFNIKMAEDIVIPEPSTIIAKPDDPNDDFELDL